MNFKINLTEIMTKTIRGKPILFDSQCTFQFHCLKLAEDLKRFGRI